VRGRVNGERLDEATQVINANARALAETRKLVEAQHAQIAQTDERLQRIEAWRLRVETAPFLQRLRWILFGR
jgi:hypothetical protein